MKLRCLSFGVTIVILLASVPALAGLYWEAVVETGGMPAGLPKNLPKEVIAQMSAGKKETVKHYLSEDGYRMENSDGVMIVDYKEMTLYQIHPHKQTYMRMDLEKMAADPSTRNLAAEMRQEFKVTPTDETRNVSGFPCRKYKVAMSMGEGEYWVSKEVPGYAYFKGLSQKMMAAHKNNPMMQQMAALENIDGFLIRSVMGVMGVETTSTVTRIMEKEVPASLFKVPAGYNEEKLPGYPGAQ